MIRTSPFKILIIVLAVILLMSCASWTVTQGAGERPPLDQAKLQYAAASLDYEAGMLAAQDLRRARLLDDAAWSIIANAQETVQRYAPIVRSGLALWEASGTQPPSLAPALAKLTASAADVQKITKEAQR